MQGGKGDDRGRITGEKLKGHSGAWKIKTQDTTRHNTKKWKSKTRNHKTKPDTRTQHNEHESRVMTPSTFSVVKYEDVLLCILTVWTCLQVRASWDATCFIKLISSWFQLSESANTHDYYLLFSLWLLYSSIQTPSEDMNLCAVSVNTESVSGVLTGAGSLLSSVCLPNRAVYYTGSFMQTTRPCCGL